MPQTQCTLLPSRSVVAVAGDDARTFLQGQLTNDVHAIERHPGMLAAACNRQGRVQATMRLATHGDDIVLVLPRTLAPALVARLSASVLRADVRIEDRSAALAVAGVIDAPPDAHWSQAAAAAAGLAMLVASPRRLLLVGDESALGRALAAVPRASQPHWDLACVADGEPTIQPETMALWLPQMLNLDLTGGISFGKGCYVGQEIVARSQHLGRIKRRMLRYVGPRAAVLHPAQTLFSGDVLAAQVVTAAHDETSTQCLAVVDLRHCSDLLGAKPGGSEFVPADLPYAIPALESNGAE